MDKIEGIDAAVEAAEMPQQTCVPEMQQGEHEAIDALLRLEQM